MKLIITGADGRMGRELLASGRVLPDTTVIPLRRGDNPNAIFSQGDVVIDFTLPEATGMFVAAAMAANKPLVIGTTGHTASGIQQIQQAAEKIPIVFSSNYSIGITVLESLTKKITSVLKDSFDIEIIEAHHKNKKDSPSGTALMLGRAAAAGLGTSLDNALAPENRSGLRPAGKIGMAVVRGGQIIGDHTVLFAGEHERLELTHRAQSRAVFAQGALVAARWVYNKPAGLYSMAEVLSLAETMRA